MSTLYKQRGIWYLDTTINYKRTRKSLHTANYLTARKISKSIEMKIIREVFTGRQLNIPDKPLIQLIEVFLDADHDWSISTKKLYSERLNAFIKN